MAKALEEQSHTELVALFNSSTFRTMSTTDKLLVLEKLDIWEPWFAWFPVRLLTWELAWLRTVRRRKAISGPPWSQGKYDYAN